MAQVPSPETKSPELPTIIIDPSLYEPELPAPQPTSSGGLARLTRVTIAVTAVGAATYGISQMRELDSILPRAQVSGLTAVFDEERPSARAEPPALTPAPEPAPSVQLAPALAHAEESVVAALPAEAPEPVSARVEEEPRSAQAPAPTKQAATKPAPIAAANDAALIAVAGAKAPEKSTAIEDDVRNARRFLALNRLDQAEAAYRKVLSLKGGEPSALTGLARVQLARGQLDDALSSAMRAVAEAPKTAGTHLTLGDVLRARGDKSGAQAHYDQASQLKPGGDGAE